VPLPAAWASIEPVGAEGRTRRAVVAPAPRWVPRPARAGQGHRSGDAARPSRRAASGRAGVERGSRAGGPAGVRSGALARGSGRAVRVRSAPPDRRGTSLPRSATRSRPPWPARRREPGSSTRSPGWLASRGSRVSRPSARSSAARPDFQRETCQETSASRATHTAPTSSSRFPRTRESSTVPRSTGRPPVRVRSRSSQT